MNNNSLDATHGGREQLNIVLLFESNSSRSHGVDIATYIQKRFHQQSCLACHLWRWDDLDDSGCQKAAAGQSTGSDLLIVASDGRRIFSEEMIGWMRSWRGKRRSHRVVVLGVVPEEKQNSSPWKKNRRTIERELGGRLNDPLFVAHDGVRTWNAGSSTKVSSRTNGAGDEILDLIAASLIAAAGTGRPDDSILLKAA